MFEKIDISKRKFSCFVCGFQFSNLDNMTMHILEKHEELRDYIKCPLCNYCVRDLTTHIKVKHPNRNLPKNYNGPNRAIVWKDQRGAASKGKKKSKFREGHFVSMKNNGKEFYYRSSYECEVLEYLEQIPEILAYDVEPFKEGIPYLYNGEKHHYFPDLSIKYADGKIEIWEIKPASQTSLEINQAKWAAANTYCQIRGWSFVIITEVGIGKLKAIVRRQKLINETRPL
jgi:hypothetical protein